ncbi:hypothetical protein M8C21_019871, partial [Ambrosia artemisiifolia]
MRRISRGTLLCVRRIRCNILCLFKWVKL